MRDFVLSFLLCGALCSCSPSLRQIPRAPAAEAEAVEFPGLTLPSEGLQRLDGNMAASIQLAMDEFLPWDAPPSSTPVVEEQCLHRRESYNVTAAPAPEGIMLVRFDLNTEACQSSDQLVHVTTYAIDIRTMRILSRAMRTRPNPARLQPLQTLPDVASPPEQALPPTSGAEGTPWPVP